MRELRRRLALRHRLAEARRAVVQRVRLGLGIPVRIEAPDREELEQRILPWLASHEGVRRVLFVGVGPYTKHYEQLFRGSEYWTIDVDRSRRRFGAGRRHVVGSIVELDRWFANGTFDLVVANGILGFGLDDRHEIEAAFAQVRRALRDGGLLLLGWDDNPPRRPVFPEQIEALRAFRPFPASLYGSWRHVTETPYRKTYDFYVAGTRPPEEPSR